ncbi:hypothetical protein U9M48_011882 [Paspalum notatum var. saurae]|uniref:RNase H type-1 domain-containing protein n=1 Tax=Paspalum notatum var. saurae TaxID=547442 RepID=A0AAQ3WHT4_PASNO
MSTTLLMIISKRLMSQDRFSSHHVDAEEIDAVACKEGLSLAAEWINKRAILETDCKSVRRL